MKLFEFLSFWLIGTFGVIALYGIQKNLELILQRLEWVHEDMKVKK